MWRGEGRVPVLLLLVVSGLGEEVGRPRCPEDGHLTFQIITGFVLSAAQHILHTEVSTAHYSSTNLQYGFKLKPAPIEFTV
jgi:hypothetical protein